MPDQFPFEMIAREFAARRVVPFLGAGASVPQYPGGNSVNESLLSACGHPKRGRKGVALQTGASYFVACNTRRTLVEMLDEVLRPEKDALPIHRYLAAMKPALIITTNYDRLIERAFVEMGAPHDVATCQIERGLSPTLLVQIGHGWQPVRGRELARFLDVQRPLIYKIHGSASGNDTVSSHYLVTEEDYEEALTNITTFLPPAIMELLDGQRMLFLGHSLADWNVRLILNRVLPSMKRSFGVVKDLSRIEEEIWIKRELSLHKLTVDKLVEGLLPYTSREVAAL